MIFEPLSSRKTAYSIDKVAPTRGGLGFEEGTVDKAALTHMVHDVPKGTGVVPKIPKSPQMSRTKKDKQEMGPVHMSPRNLRFRKLSMEEKGKIVTIKIDEEKEDL